MIKEFWGYPRADGKVGTRNKVLVLATVHCSYVPAKEIAKFEPNAVTVTHYWNCRSTGEGQEMVVNCLAEICKHPNIGAVLLVGQGCEEISVSLLSERVSDSGKPCGTIVCQEEGSIRAIERGRQLLTDLVEKTVAEERKKVSVNNLKVALQCGASDFSNGLFSHRAIGKAVDRLIEAGATVIFSEVGELIGTEDMLEKRATTRTVAQKVRSAIEDERKRWMSPQRSFSSHGDHGNVRGGLSTIEEKSGGAVVKIGSKAIQDVLEYSVKSIEKPSVQGLYLQNQDGYGSDIGSITAMAAAGAQIAVFATGSGTTVGHAIIPVYKVTANEETYSRMKDNIDYFVTPADNYLKDSYDEEGIQILKRIIRVASGTQTKAEELGQDDFAVLRISPV